MNHLLRPRYNFILTVFAWRLNFHTKPRLIQVLIICTRHSSTVERVCCSRRSNLTGLGPVLLASLDGVKFVSVLRDASSNVSLYTNDMALGISWPQRCPPNPVSLRRVGR